MAKKPKNNKRILACFYNKNWIIKKTRKKNYYISEAVNKKYKKL